MKLLLTSIATLSLTLSAACSKKEDKPAAPPAAPAESAPPSAPAAQPEAPAQPAAPAAAPATPAEVAELPEGMPAVCTDARAAMVKLKDCAKQDEKMRATMVDAWNQAVKGSFVHYKTSSADNRRRPWNAAARRWGRPSGCLPRTAERHGSLPSTRTMSPIRTSPPRSTLAVTPPDHASLGSRRDRARRPSWSTARTARSRRG